jgi:hypothetical protein
MCSSGSPTLTPPMAWPGKSESAQLFGATDAEVVVDRTLVDAEQVAARGEETAVLGELEHLLGPADGAPHGDLA